MVAATPGAIILGTPEGSTGLAEEALIPGDASGSSLAPAEDPLSPVGDPGNTGAPDLGVLMSSSSSSSGQHFVHVWMETIEATTYEFGQAPTGKFRFHATACGTPTLPSYVTVNYSRPGTATAVSDYSGTLATQISVQINLTPLGGNWSTATNASGFADRTFIAVDDDIEEPPGEESVIAIIGSATDSYGNPADLITSPRGEGAVVSNDYSHTSLTPSPMQLKRDGSETKSINLRIQKDGDPAKANGIRCTILSIKNEAGKPSTSITIFPRDFQNTGRVEVDGEQKDGVASFSVWGNPNAPDQAVYVNVRFRFEPTDATQPASSLEREVRIILQ